jgi:hypothetical protein
MPLCIEPKYSAASNGQKRDLDALCPNDPRKKRGGGFLSAIGRRAFV